jgi:serine protease Do
MAAGLSRGAMPFSLALGVLLAAALPPAPARSAAQSSLPANQPKAADNAAAMQQPIPLPSLAPLVQRVQGAVVNVSVEIDGDAIASGGSQGAGRSAQGDTPFEKFLRRFFDNPGNGLPGSPGQKIVAVGSGFIIDPSGYIVTNNHVAGKAKKVTVILQDNSRHSAKVVGGDDKTDLALLKIDTNRKLPFVTWGNSNDAKVGDWVVAVGNPFGLGGTVTAGIISALGRNINEGPFDDFLQIDAPINRGNSGGPTFNLSGQVIGINTAIYSPSGGSVGIGFAVPSKIAQKVVAQLKEHGHATWGWLGVMVQGITPSIAKSLGLNQENPHGALVAGVTPDSPAAKAGLKPGDVITAAGGRPIKNVHDLPRIVAATPAGQKLDFAVLRDGKKTTVTATIAELTKKAEMAARTEEQPAAPNRGDSALGMRLAPLDQAMRSRLRLGKDAQGVVVAEIDPSSPVRALGLQPGDVIVSINQEAVKSPKDASERLRRAAAAGNILLLLNRHGVNQFVGLSVQGKPMSGE